MALIDRYLFAIKAQLPEAQREDVTAELRDTLLSQAEEREAELGRPLDEDDWTPILRRMGHPVVVAGRYAPHSQLIGPRTYPFYALAVRIGAMILVAVHVVFVLLALLSGADPVAAVIGNLFSLLNDGVFMFGLATLAAVAADRSPRAQQRLERWDPRRLPALNLRPRKRPVELIFEVIVEGAFLLWWIGLLHLPMSRLIGESGVDVVFASAWTAFYWPVIAVVILRMAGNLMDLLRPDLARLGAALGIAGNLGLAVMALAFLRIRDWVSVSAPGLSPERLAEIDRGVELGLMATAMFTVAVAAYEVFRIVWRFRRPQSTIDE